VHIVIWKFDVMEGKNRQDLLTVMHGAAPDFQGVPGLVRKHYCIAPDCRSVLEIYLWQSKAAADKFFDHAWDAETSRRWESARMTRQDFEAPVVVESAQNRVVSDA